MVLGEATGGVRARRADERLRVRGEQPIIGVPGHICDFCMMGMGRKSTRALVVEWTVEDAVGS